MEDDLILLTEHGTAAPGDTGEKSLDSLHHGEMDSDNWTLIHRWRWTRQAGLEGADFASSERCIPTRENVSVLSVSIVPKRFVLS